MLKSKAVTIHEACIRYYQGILFYGGQRNSHVPGNDFLNHNLNECLLAQQKIWNEAKS